MLKNYTGLDFPLQNLHNLHFVRIPFLVDFRIVDLIKPQTVRAGLADQSASCNGFDSKTRPYQISNLFNSHSLRVGRCPRLLGLNQIF